VALYQRLEVHALAPLPAWERKPALTLARCQTAFDHTLSYTIGVEEELMLVDPVSFDLAPAVDRVLALVDRDARYTRELRSAQLEIVTPVCASAADACRELGHARRHLIERIGGDVRLLGSGTHPFSTRHGEITEALRYRQIADEYVWTVTRSLMCGLHVHVAVPGADRALAVYNRLRSYLPELAALGANSPFFEGVDSGMCSIRPKLNELCPRSGVPPAFETWADLVRYVEWGQRGGLFPDASHFWWELRPHPVHGTIEIRVADTQTRLEDATAIVALIQALVAFISERFDAGEHLPVHETHWIAENAWRGHRYGVRGWLVDLDTGEPVPTRERLSRLIDELEPYAARFGSEGQLHDARSLLAGNGCERQRYVHEREGPVGLTRWLVEQTEASALDA
jgi:carboxylate-amine ligase